MYRGRFAPSPTGLLHFGSLFAAVLSYLEARRNKGAWLVRIEDIDPLREQESAKEGILHTLAAHALIPDEPVVFQSQRSRLYEEVLKKLATSGYTYACPCSRKYLSEHAGVHLPACRDQQTDELESAIKFRADTTIYSWQDSYQGAQSHALSEDFVLKRKEGFYAYQLAVVCDDIDQDISHVIRGYDLLDSTPMQLALYQALNREPPTFGHFPVIISEAGQKLSKQNLSPAVDEHSTLNNLLKVFKVAGIDLQTRVDTCEQALFEASRVWQPELLYGKRELRQAQDG